MMLRPAARSRGQKSKIADQITLPAPTNGWYVGENMAKAPELTAFRLDNWFPQTDYVRLRRGTTEFATGMGAAVETVFVYELGSNNSKMFGAAGGSIYDASSGGAVGVAAVTGLTEDSWHYVQFTTSGGTFLRAVNGADTSLLYDGSTWATTAITGVSSDTLNAVWAYKNRLYFVEEGTQNSWYLSVDSVSGAATKFPLAGVFTGGGNLLIGSAWSINSGSGISELNVFISDQGDVALYQGTQPGDATTWGLIGTYKIPKPLGRDCLMKTGGDLAIMTEDGIVAMSQVISLDRIALANAALTKPIAPAWREAVLARTSVSGWKIVLWPREGMAFVSLPSLGADDLQQFVANARSGAWCRYTGWDVVSWGVFNANLYYGDTTGRIMRAEDSGADDDALYTGVCIFSFSDWQRGPNRKSLTAARLQYRTSYNITPKLEMLVDYDTDVSTAPGADAIAPTTALWDVALWDTAVWPGSLAQAGSWKTVHGLGSVMAPCVQASVSNTASPDFRLQQIDMLFEPADTPLG